MRTIQLATGLALIGLALSNGARGQGDLNAPTAAMELQATIAAELTPTTGPVPGDAPQEIAAEEVPLGEAIPQESPPDGTEVVQERYPNRNIKVERHVIQDEDENYVNQGPWKMYDPEGNLIASGNYARNQREGEWSRWYRAEDAKLFEKAPYDQFEPPFLSRAQFQSDLMEGTWTIFDSKKLKVSEWNFSGGKRHGKSTWWYPNGQPMRELNYEDGELNGEMLEWLPDGSLVTRDHYEQGRRAHKEGTNFPGGQKKSEGTYLDAKILVKTPDDWWNATEPTYVSTGKKEKHGPWTSWYESGQKKVEGNYSHDQPDGTFLWWHPNGQRAVQAEYSQGKQDGNWTWWHDNGQKAISGAYAAGKPSGRWVWWEETGKVAQRVDFSSPDSQSMVREIPQPALEPTLPAPGDVDRSVRRPVLQK